MASHDFVKPHRHTPAEDTPLQRIRDVLYVLAVAASNTFSDWIEDDARRAAAWLRRRRRRR